MLSEESLYPFQCLVKTFFVFSAFFAYLGFFFSDLCCSCTMVLFLCLAHFEKNQADSLIILLMLSFT